MEVEHQTFKGSSQVCDSAMSHTLSLFKDVCAQEVSIGLGVRGRGFQDVIACFSLS